MNYVKPRKKKCDACGKGFLAYSPKQLRCPPCQMKHDLTVHREYVRRWFRAHATFDHARRTCPACGKAFEPVRGDHKFCSQRCYNQARQGAKHIERTCKRCGKPFVTRRLSQKYCTHECMVLWNRHNDGEKARAARKAARKERKAPPERKAMVRVARDSKPAEMVPWERIVEADMRLERRERYQASLKWTPRMRAYAQKLALKEIGWKGVAVYG